MLKHLTGGLASCVFLLPVILNINILCSNLHACENYVDLPLRSKPYSYLGPKEPTVLGFLIMISLN